MEDGNTETCPRLVKFRFVFVAEQMTQTAERRARRISAAKLSGENIEYNITLFMQNDDGRFSGEMQRIAFRLMLSSCVWVSVCVCVCMPRL